MKTSLQPVSSGVNDPHVDLLLRKTVKGDPIDLSAGLEIMICNGTGRCVYQDTCEFCHPDSELQPPVGDRCPIEIVFIVRHYEGYHAEICPDGANWSLECLVADVVGLELKVARAERAMAIDGAIVELVAVGMDKASGEAIRRPEVSTKLNAFRAALRDKHRLMEQMGLTPKSRAAIGSTMQVDPSTYAANMVSAFEDIMRKKKERGLAEKQGGLLDDPDRTQGEIIDVSFEEKRPAPAGVSSESGPKVNNGAANNTVGHAETPEAKSKHASVSDRWGVGTVDTAVAGESGCDDQASPEPREEVGGVGGGRSVPPIEERDEDDEECGEAEAADGFVGRYCSSAPDY